MKKGYGRYIVKVGSFKDGKRFDVLDNHSDKSDYAFSKQDGTIYSYSPLAVKFVNRVTKLDDSFVKNAQPGKCYQFIMDGPFGGLLEIVEVPTSWYC